MKNLAKSLYLDFFSPIEWALIIAVCVAGLLLYWDYNDVEKPLYNDGSGIASADINAERNIAQEVPVESESVEVDSEGVSADGTDEEMY